MKESLIKSISAVDNVFAVIEKYFTAVPLLIFTFLIFANVIARYVFLNAITFAEELSRMLNILLVYVAISAGIKTGTHIGMDAFITLCVPKHLYKTHKFLRILKLTVVLIFCVIVAVLGFQLTQRIYDMNQLSAALRIPMWIPYLVVPIGLSMTSVRCVMVIILEYLKPAKPDAPEPQVDNSKDGGKLPGEVRS